MRRGPSPAFLTGALPPPALHIAAKTMTFTGTAMSSLIRAALFALGALILVSCAAGGKVRTVTYGYPYGPYTARSFAAWAGSGGPLLVELRNNPYPNSPQQVADVIADAASSSYVLPGVRFTANP